MIPVLDELKSEILRFARETNQQLDHFDENCPEEQVQVEVRSLRRHLNLLAHEAFQLTAYIKTLADKMV